MTKIAFLFPGQGSQKVGMGQALSADSQKTRHLFEEVNDALGKDLSRLMFEGPADELNATENTQPALMAMSMALWAELRSAVDKRVLTEAVYAGHSLGEYSALGALEVWRAADLARTLQQRGRAMQEATPKGVGGMAALIGPGGVAKAEELCAAVSTAETYAEVANDNSEQQVVISGHAEAVDQAVARADEFEFKRAVKLPVSAPFHCRLMTPAQEKMEAVLSKLPAPADLPSAYYPNVSAAPVTSGDQVIQCLTDQITGRVRWRETIQHMHKSGVTHFIEVGAGNVLTNMVKRAYSDVTCVAIQSLQDIDDFLAKL